MSISLMVLLWACQAVAALFVMARTGKIIGGDIYMAVLWPVFLVSSVLYLAYLKADDFTSAVLWRRK